MMTVAGPSLFGPGFLDDPYPAYNAAREAQPALRLPLYGGGWFVWRYADIAALARDPRLSSKRSSRFFAPVPLEERHIFAESIKIFEQELIFVDPPQHTRLRKLMMKAFTPEAIKPLSTRIAAIFDSLIDRHLHNGGLEYMSAVAHQLPALVIGDMFGVPVSDWERLMEWSNAIAELIGSASPTVDTVVRNHEATLAMRDYFQIAVEQRRTNPTGDLISFLVASEEEGEVLDQAELLAQCIIVLAAGHETTRNLLGNGLALLFRYPEALDALRRNPDLTRSAVEEFLRFDPPVQAVARTATAEIDLHGDTARPGEYVMLVTASGSRDPREFPNPETFDIRRKNNAHLTFGAGAHACLGAHLARLEANVVFPRLLDRFPNLRLAGVPQRAPNWALRGFSSLPVAL